MPLLTGLLQQADDTHPGTLSNRLRERRFRQFEAWADGLRRPGEPLTILDVGGTQDYWEARGWAGRADVHITLLNLQAEPVSHPNMESLAGDASSLAFADNQFRIVFSNSVIEHVGSLTNQMRMARGVRRVGEHYWVQTPNFWFPMEPHYLIPGWQWLPEDLRVAVLTRRSVGQLGRTPDRDEARRVIRGTMLVRRGELKRWFPGATLLPERVGPLVKSWTAYA
jgi:hypothetical protein